MTFSKPLSRGIAKNLKKKRIFFFFASVKKHVETSKAEMECGAAEGVGGVGGVRPTPGMHDRLIG